MTSTSGQTVSAKTKLVVDDSALPTVSAKAFTILDVKTGAPVIGFNQEKVLPIASVTKLFTAAALFDLTKFSGSITIAYSDVATEGRAGKLVAGQVYPYHELVYAMLLESSNDAAAAILRAEPEVLGYMNKSNDVEFSDTSGLSSRNEASAITLARDVLDLYARYPHIFAITKKSELIGEYTGWHNNNPISDLASFEGGKHGFTPAAGKTAAVVLEVSIDGEAHEFVVAMLGSDDLVSDIEQLEEFIRKQVHYN